MMGLNSSELWQRRYVIEQTLSAFAELELKFPQAAEMARLAEINARQTPGGTDAPEGVNEILNSLFNQPSLSKEEEAENQAWRDFVKATCAFVSQIFHASRNMMADEKREDRDMQALRAHGDARIGNLVAPYWKSFELYGKHWLYDDDLRDLVLMIVERAAAQERFTGDLEDTHA